VASDKFSKRTWHSSCFSDCFVLVGRYKTLYLAGSHLGGEYCNFSALLMMLLLCINARGMELLRGRILFLGILRGNTVLVVSCRDKETESFEIENSIVKILFVTVSFLSLLFLKMEMIFWSFNEKLKSSRHKPFEKDFLPEF